MKKILLLLSLTLLFNFNGFGQDYTITKNLPLAQISGTPNIVNIGPETSSLA